jgi:alkanesulfonate monooxygenase SsuD/methylene tetrahydromethanopterin reductase-like flavin-dependent oxidoreductase (luciferase family)
MHYGVTLPNMYLGDDPRVMVELGEQAEAAGWDGVFIWDAVHIVLSVEPVDRPTFDPWIALAALAMRTERVQLGTMITPLSRRRPWKVARETMTLDRLSHGRLILPVGLGAVDDGAFSRVGEEVDRRKRAELLDESLDILAGLWSGEPFSHAGAHYTLQEMRFLPTPTQQPRIPIWVVGAWPRMKSMRRAVRWDGLLPSKIGDDGAQQDVTPDDIREMRAFAERERASAADAAPFEIIWEGETPGDDPTAAAALVRPWEAAGVTWWLEAVWKGPETRAGLEGMRERIRQGPPPRE